VSGLQSGHYTIYIYGPGSSVGIATDYGLDGPGSNPGGLQPGHYSSLAAPNLQPTANQERNDQCGKQHYSRELLMMGIVVHETC